MILTIFDIDGTICDSGEVEGTCFAKAVETVTGIALSTLDWAEYPEPTSSGIVRKLLEGDPETRQKEAAIKAEFCRLLGSARQSYPQEFVPISGALAFIKRLQYEGIARVAIATGCFDDEARFKLACCGVEMDVFPHATSSDTPRRRDILPLAASRAGASTSDTVYFGDAPWDFAVSRALPVAMIGIGRRIEELAKMGLEHTFADFSNEDAILDAISSLTAKPRESVHSMVSSAGRSIP